MTRYAAAVLCVGAAIETLAALSPSTGPLLPPPRLVRAMTYNIHHGEGVDGQVDLSRIAAVINRSAPDLVAVQEVDRGTVRSGRIDQLAELRRLTGMHAAFGWATDYQGGGYGVAVLSRHPLRDVRNRALPHSTDREPRTALTVEIEPGGGMPRLQFTSTHLDNGRQAMDKVAQASYLAAAWSGTDDAAILAGDLNTRGGTPALQILAREWTDMFIEIDQAVASRRIDYVMARPAAAWRTRESRVVEAPLASDHQPVLVVLEWLGGRGDRSRLKASERATSR